MQGNCREYDIEYIVPDTSKVMQVFLLIKGPVADSVLLTWVEFPTDISRSHCGLMHSAEIVLEKVPILNRGSRDTSGVFTASKSCFTAMCITCWCNFMAPN